MNDVILAAIIGGFIGGICAIIAALIAVYPYWRSQKREEMRELAELSRAEHLREEFRCPKIGYRPINRSKMGLVPRVKSKIWKK